MVALKGTDMSVLVGITVLDRNYHHSPQKHCMFYQAVSTI
jgi:hypothetical protein